MYVHKPTRIILILFARVGRTAGPEYFCRDQFLFTAMPLWLIIETSLETQNYEVTCDCNLFFVR